LKKLVKERTDENDRQRIPKIKSRIAAEMPIRQKYFFFWLPTACYEIPDEWEWIGKRGARRKRELGDSLVSVVNGGDVEPG